MYTISPNKLSMDILCIAIQIVVHKNMTVDQNVDPPSLDRRVSGGVCNTYSATKQESKTFYFPKF